MRFMGGGTTLIDLMKLNVERPNILIDINSIPLDKIEATPDGGLKIGGMVRNSDLAHDAVEPRLAVRRLGHDLPQPPQDDAQRRL